MTPESIDKRGSQRGWIEVICGSMFSGKTEELIRRMRRAQFARQNVEIFKPMVDVRYSDTEVVSHDKKAIPSTPVPHSSQLLLMGSGVDVIGIDEAQFFDDGLPEVCSQLANQGIRVICAGLDLDFLGRPFGPMPELLAIAEFVTKVHAICIKTGDLAHHSFRLNQDNSLVALGEKDLYVPLSREAFQRAMKDPSYITEEDLAAIRSVLEKEEPEPTEDAQPDELA
ncbi:thymidine kinase [Sanyastnella coralliicola]|uniref:thymidine kinase n=1 Tax=Sanyastnella coralliicola TaxID=3069118 RepID=UPI0027BA5FF4|nr:thymidine kinase [Longitalea sp. SCSIO 12813]